MEDKENIENSELQSSMFDSADIDDGLGDFDFGEVQDEKKVQEDELVQKQDEALEQVEDLKEVKEEESLAETDFEDFKKDDLLAGFSVNEEQIEQVESVEKNETSKQQKEQNYVSTMSDFEEEETHTEELITVRPIKFQDFEDTPPNRAIKKNLDILQDVNLHISVELGRTKSTIRDVMELEKGSIVELEKIAGEQVEVFVNEKLVAKGEVIVIEDKFGVRVTSTNIVKSV